MVARKNSNAWGLVRTSIGWLFTGPISFLLENSAFLIAGAVSGLVWANVDGPSYLEAKHLLHFVVNDVGMAFFFLLAGKEIREAMLPGGALSSRKTATLPLLATLGGMAGPALIYVAGAQLLNPALTRGWAIPVATDIAFSYLVAQLIFRRVGGKPHPAIVFLLLLAIADDAGGIVVLAAFYPHGEMNLPLFAGGLALAIGLALLLFKKLRVVSFWPYLLGPGVISWLAFHHGGIHPALALVPLAWCMPHAHSDLGIWAEGEAAQGKDTLNRLEHWWKTPVELILGLFGFVNAGVVLSALGTGTWLVFVALLCGKPLGIVLFTKLGQRLGLALPKGMTARHLIVVGLAAGIGFTVALFVSAVSFPEGPLQDSVKMGALFSFAVAPISLLAAKLLRIKHIDQQRQHQHELPL